MNPIQADIYIAATAEDVWTALTSKAGVAQLYFGSRLDTTFAAGSPYRYLGDDGQGHEVVHVEGEVLAARSSELLQLTHRAGPMWRIDGKVFTSRVAYAIQCLGWATKVSITHDQFQEGDPAWAHQQSGWMM